MAPVTRKGNEVASKPTARRSTVRQPAFTKVMTELNVSHKKACMLCGKTQISEKLYGLLYQLHDIVVHYFCILLSSRAAQNGADNEGIWGFLLKDIKDELTRGSTVNCFYCKKKGATISCCEKKCQKQFHLPCGLKNGSMHQYFQSFKSFCQNHLIPQTIDLFELQNAAPTLCAICKDDVKPTPLPTTLWAPCCKRNAWFHRECVQDLALSAGYFFKCPLCNNVDKFKSRMLNLGIYIPSRDASWETVPGAFEELSERHNTCNAVKCLCPHQGKRNYHHEVKGSWKLILCQLCGSNGTHALCSDVKCDEEWCCNTCQAIEDKKGQLELPNNRNRSGNSVVVLEERVSSQNVSQRQNSEIILNEAQPQPLNDAIIISDDSDDSSVEMTDVQLPNTQMEVVQTPQIRLPIIASYRSLSTSTRNRSNRRFSVSTSQSTCINLISDDDDDGEYDMN